jgi:hypothetical protein
MSLKKRILAAATALLAGVIIWIPCLHWLFQQAPSQFYQPSGLSAEARQLAARHLKLWTDPALKQQQLARMRASNAEWDFMGRSFLVWSLANMGLRDPGSRPMYLQTMDQIIDETLRLEKENGMYFFLMPYARASAYVSQPARSLFLDGEIALMLASRRMVEEKAEYKTLLKDRLDEIARRLETSRSLVIESYPDECWMFDHVVALDAMRVADFLDGSDHSALIQRWLRMARQDLVHRDSGLLISSFTSDHWPIDGPEGSTIWLVAHGLQLLDPEFARGQYDRARRQLGKITVGFGYAQEWPSSWKGHADVDSGPIIPGFNISAGSSGMAFIGATAFGDEAYLSSLLGTIRFSGFPSRHSGQLKFCASNQVGDAALLYASTLGPIWHKVTGGTTL